MNLKSLLCNELQRQLEAGRVTRVMLPAGGDLIWRWFIDLNKSRSRHTTGPNPITYAEIDAYSRLTRWPIEPRHLEILMAMDRVFLAFSNRPAQQAPEGVKIASPISQVPISAGLLDALFG
jgi:hypothetical protein